MFGGLDSAGSVILVNPHVVNILYSCVYIVFMAFSGLIKE